jgi:hypothetical protein
MEIKNVHSDGSDTEQYTWYTDAVEYEDVSPSCFVYIFKTDDKIPTPYLVDGLSTNQSAGSLDKDFAGRRTISSPLINLAPSVRNAFINLSAVPSAQSTIDFNVQNKVSMMLAPVNSKQIQQEETLFASAIHDPSISFSPHVLGFIPYKLWQDRFYTFGELVTDFFQRKNHSSCRFSYKLYNALKLSILSPNISSLVGVKWLSDKIIRVDKRNFARLLGIKSVDGSLFHQQGNFTSHGFCEITAEEVHIKCPKVDLTGVDFDNVRLLYHLEGVFVTSATENDIVNCRWTSVKR